MFRMYCRYSTVINLVHRGQDHQRTVVVVLALQMVETEVEEMEMVKMEMVEMEKDNEACLFTSNRGAERN